MKFFKETHIPFIKFSKTAIILSGIALLISVVSIFFIRGFNLGIDFTGGTLMQVRFEKPVTTAEIRTALSTVNLQNSIIQKSAGINEFMIRVAQDTEAETDVPDLIAQALSGMDNNPYEIRRTEKVGPKIGQELRRNTVYAVIFALLVIGIYISIRFQFRFAIGAVIALIHDVLFTLGVFSLAQLEISLSTIAAFLTIVGYSLNDTIVLYDRIREDLKVMRFEPIETIVNNSINETLSRTIITSLTTFFVVFVLVFTSGEVQIFSIAMMIGVIIGTYSSIYIAGPVVIAWQNKFSAKKK